MSSMGMNMFALPIWASNFSKAEIKRAKTAGWKRHELWWESLQHQGNELLDQGDTTKAVSKFQHANLISKLYLQKTDLRCATSIANLAIAKAQLNSSEPDKKEMIHALKLFEAQAASAIESMEIAPRSRSSLFHMRMETIHRATYHDNLRVRIGKFADETRQTLEALGEGQPSSHRHFSRWKGERPPVFDDTRRVLSACLLLADSG